MTASAERDAQLRAVWADKPGLWGFLTTVSHKRIAARYILTAIALLFLAGMLALDMRLQLSQPDMGRMDPQQYNEAFSLHGSTMLFLVSVPVMEAMALWLVPLMLGQRNMAFPRLAAFSYWLYLGGVLMLWIPHALGITPDLGWFEYPPLSGPDLFARAPRRCLGADDHLHRSRGAQRVGQRRGDDPEDAPARHDAGPDAAVPVGDADRLADDDLRAACRHAGDVAC